MEKIIGGGGSRTRVLDRHHNDLYMLVPTLLFIVFRLCRRTRRLSDCSQNFLTVRPWEAVSQPEHCPRSYPLVSVRVRTSLHLGSEGELFVRRYYCDRWFTRPTIILGMPSKLSLSSRDRNAPMKRISKNLIGCCRVCIQWTMLFVVAIAIVVVIDWTRLPITIAASLIAIHTLLNSYQLSIQWTNPNNTIACENEYTTRQKKQTPNNDINCKSCKLPRQSFRSIILQNAYHLVK